MLKIPIRDIEQIAEDRKWSLYRDDLISAGIIVSHGGDDYLLIDPETYRFFENKYENFKWPNSISDTAP